jgi:hypothetical protein
VAKQGVNIRSVIKAPDLNSPVVRRAVQGVCAVPKSQAGHLQAAADSNSKNRCSRT